LLQTNSDGPVLQFPATLSYAKPLSVSTAGLRPPLLTLSEPTPTAIGDFPCRRASQTTAG